MKKNICLLTVLLVLFAGCTKRPAVITYSWWGTEYRASYTLRGIELFERLNPTITVAPVYSALEAYSDLYRSKMHAGTEEDVMLIDYSWLYEFSEDGMGYYDLSEFTNVINLNGFKKEELRLGMMNGALNAIPVALNTNVFYYNLDVLANNGIYYLPRSWNALFDIAKKLDGRYYILAMSEKSIWYACVAYVEQNCGRAIIVDESTFSFTRQDVHDMLHIALRFINEKVTPVPLDYSAFSGSKENVAGYLGWISSAEILADDAVRRGDKIVVGDFLGAYSGKRSGYYIKPSMLYAMKRDTRHPEEAARFIDYLINNDYLASLQGIEKGYPINDYVSRDIDKHEMPLQHEAYLRMENDGEKMQLQSPCFENEDAMAALVEAYTGVLGGADESEAADRLYERLLAIYGSLAQ